MTHPTPTVPSDVHLREAGPRDLAAVIALDRATESAPHWPRATYAEMVQQAASPVRRRLIIAERIAEGSGAAAPHIIGFAVEAVHDGTAELESVAIATAARRSGVGRALCESAADRSRQQGAKEMTLEVRAANTAAIALYAGLGFKEIARRPRYYRDPEDDAVMMRLPLIQSPAITVGRTSQPGERHS